MLAAIYNKREDYALKILQDAKHEAWGNLTPVALALSAADQKFIAVPVVQQLINQIWVGQERLKKEYVRLEDRCCGERSPRFKFICYYCTYFPFLLLYSFFTLFMMDHEHVSNTKANIVDFCLFLFVLSILMRRIVDYLIGKFVIRRPSVGRHSMSVTWFWYWFGTVTVVLHTIGFIMRLAGGKVMDDNPMPNIQAPKSNNTASAPFHIGQDFGKLIMSQFDAAMTQAKVLYCIAVFCFWFQLWELMVIVPKLGPYIYLIGRMLSHFFSFMVILIVLMTGYAVASQSLIYPQRDFEFNILTELYYFPYFQLYGELFLTETTGKGSIDGCHEHIVRTPDGVWCPKYNPLATIFLVIYLLLGIILLVNLLIAVFSFQYESCYEEFDTIWKFQVAMSVLVWDQYTSLPPPLSLLTNLFQLVNILRIITARTGMYIISAAYHDGKVEDQDLRPSDKDWLLLYEQRCLKLQLREQKMKDLEKSLKNKKRKAKKKSDFWVPDPNGRRQSEGGPERERSILHRSLHSAGPLPGSRDHSPDRKEKRSSKDKVLKMLKDPRSTSGRSKHKHHKHEGSSHDGEEE